MADLVLGIGPEECQIAFVGENPGLHELREGKPFVKSAPAGREFSRLLSKAGIVRDTCYITNVIKEHVPRNEMPKFIEFIRGGRVVESERYKAYENLLRQELSAVKANVIVAVGAIALWALCKKVKITKQRGSILESTLLPGRKVIPIIHPSANFKMYNYTYWTALDLERVLSESFFPEIKLPQRDLKISPTYDQSMKYLNECSKLDKLGFDIEVMRGEVSCLSFAKSPADALCIPFVQNKGAKSYFTPEQELEIWFEVARLLENPEIAIIGQNILFDSGFIYERYGIVTENMRDTMVAHAMLYPDFPAGLDFLVSTLTREPYFKDDGKAWINIHVTDEEFWTYNAKDASTTFECNYQLEKDLAKMRLLDAYENQLKLIQPLLYMKTRGIRLDHEGLAHLLISTKEKIAKLLIEFQDACGYAINPRSPKQLAEYFYIKKGYKPQLGKNKKWTTDIDALKALARLGSEEARILMKYRKLEKLRSTYLEINISPDGRLRGSYNPAGTKNGRVSSSKIPAFDTGRKEEGANMLTLPHEYKRFLKTDDGMVFYNIDLAKAEAVVVAYISPDQNMIEALETNQDLHSKTAGYIFDKSIDEVSNKDGSCALGTGEHSERFWGKKANHSLNYGLGPMQFAKKYECSVAEAKVIIRKYFMGYPGVLQYHNWVKDKIRQDSTLIDLYGKRRLFFGRKDDVLFRDAYAFIPQSTVSSKVNRNGIQFILEHPKIFSEVEILNFVYDSLELQIPLASVDKHAEMLLRLKENLETPLRWLGNEFVIKADIACGMNLGKEYMKEIPDTYNTVESLTKKLKEIHEELLSSQS